MNFTDYAAIVGYAVIGGSAVITLRWLTYELSKRRFLREMQAAYARVRREDED